jgi:hypothetical protein
VAFFIYGFADEVVGTCAAAALFVNPEWDSSHK